MPERKETAARDAAGVRKQSYSRFKEGKAFSEIQASHTAALCDMMRAGIFGEEVTEDGQRIRHAGGRPRKIETVEELREGIERYIDHIQTSAAAGVPLIPDVEGLALFLGISRSTLFEWQKARPGEFSDTIKTTLNAIAAYKKQLALTGKIPPIVFATDFNNNHGYVQQHTLEVQATNRMNALPDRAEIVKRLPTQAAEDAREDVDLSGLDI